MRLPFIHIAATGLVAAGLTVALAGTADTPDVAPGRRALAVPTDFADVPATAGAMTWLCRIIHDLQDVWDRGLVDLLYSVIRSAADDDQSPVSAQPAFAESARPGNSPNGGLR